MGRNVVSQKMNFEDPDKDPSKGVIKLEQNFV
jgi:hypothetical protein